MYYSTKILEYFENSKKFTGKVKSSIFSLIFLDKKTNENNIYRQSRNFSFILYFVLFFVDTWNDWLKMCLQKCLFLQFVTFDIKNKTIVTNLLYKKKTNEKKHICLLCLMNK